MTFFGIFGDESTREDKEDTSKETEGKLFLREEKLDISKDKKQTGEVKLHKNVIEELKSVDVPLTHDEVVIERRAISHEPSDEPVGDEEIIRIPVNREFVNVGKHTELVGEVSAYRREVEDIKEIEETLKREEAQVHSSGDTNIIPNESDQLR